MRKNFKWIWYIYLITLFLVVVVKFDGSTTTLGERIANTQYNRTIGLPNYDLDFLYSIKIYWQYRSEIWAIKNLVGNIVPFIPFGFIFPIVYPKHSHWFTVFIASFLFVLGIESFQFITLLGVFSVDDIFLNVLSMVFGYLLFLFVRFVRRRYVKRI